MNPKPPTTMNALNTNAIRSAAVRMHRNAIGKARVVRINGGRYILWYNPNNCCFETTNPDGTAGQSWNTRQIATAAKWLREYYA